MSLKIKEITEQLDKYIEELKTIKFEKISNEESNFLSKEVYRCTLNNGHVIVRDKLLKNGKDGYASHVMPITKDGEVLLVIQPRNFTQRTVSVGFPAGYTETGEDELTSAKREFLEETGYASNEFVYLGTYYPDTGCSGAKNSYYIAMDCEKVADQHLDETEFIKYMLVPYECLDELVKLGYINSLSSVFFITKSKEYINDIRKRVRK